VILPDVNVLVYAFRRAAPEHERYAAWLNEVVEGAEELALHDLPLVGLVRIVTNPRVVREPAPVSLALEFVNRLIDAPRARWVSGGPRAWSRFAELAGGDRFLGGNLTPDAYLASLALTHRCRLATADRGFARFPGLDWFDPAAV
jgi:toxin-antitoxin system PIN domain toxin